MRGPVKRNKLIVSSKFVDRCVVSVITAIYEGDDILIKPPSPVHRIIGVCLLTSFAMFVYAGPWQGKKISGWVEDAYVFPDKLVVRAKIDTGAENSSLNAPGSIAYEHQGVARVRFRLANRRGEEIYIDRPVVRTARIKRQGGRHEERPVIKLELCLSGIRKTVDVTVTDRTGFDYQLLIGRSFLADDFLVDPAVIDASNTACRDR